MAPVHRVELTITHCDGAECDAVWVRDIRNVPGLASVTGRSWTFMSAEYGNALTVRADGCSAIRAGTDVWGCHRFTRVALGGRLVTCTSRFPRYPLPHIAGCVCQSRAMSAVNLRPAHAAEAAKLSDLAMRSKAYWGYDPAFLAACRDELTVAPQACDGVHVLAAEQDGVLVGYYQLTGEPPDGELAALFVDPATIGRGIGGELIAHARGHAYHLGYRMLTIESDPHAEPFYIHAGARRVGETPSGSIADRVLPTLELPVTPPRALR